MGRWSQRRLAGGGGPHTNPSTLTSITQALIDSPTTAIVTYDNAVHASAFSLADFTSKPTTNAHPANISQGAPNELELDFFSSISLDTQLTYAGTVSGVLSPQTEPY